MSNDTSAFGFGKFIPGFDFLQRLTRAGKEASTSPLSSWVAPTVSVEEISKRIEELKAVQFWLEQNSRALAATVQALEVQKMTLSTLKGMNVSMADLAKSFTGHAAAASAANPFAAAADTAAAHAGWPMSPPADPAPEPAPAAAAGKAQAQPQAKAAEREADAGDAGGDASAAPGSADPMQWWGALTQQFQQIAGQAMQDPAQQQAMAQATHMATDFTKAAMKAAGDIVRNATEAAQAPAASKATGAAKAAQPEGKPTESAKSAAASAKAPAAKRATAEKTAAKPAGKTPAKAAAKSTAARSPRR